MRTVTGLLLGLLFGFQALGQSHYHHNVVWGRLALTDTLSKNISMASRTPPGYIYQIQQRISGKEFDHANVLYGVLTFDNLFSQFRRANRSQVL